MDDEQRSAPARPLWDRIQEVCAARGWTMTRLERESGVTRKTIANWKTQPRSPQAANVNAVADTLGIDRAEALQLAGVLSREAEKAGSDSGIEELRAEVERLRQLNAEQQQLNAEQQRRNEEQGRREAELRRRLDELIARQHPAEPADETGEDPASEVGRRAG